MADLPEVFPKDYVLRFPFFIQGASNAHIVFSPKENPGLEDNAYELVIGGWGNTRMTIRKRIDGYPLADIIMPNVLYVLKKKQFVFEVTLDGEIRLYTEDDPFKPTLIGYDPVPLKLEYLSFKNYENEKLTLYYGYDPAQLSNIIVKEEKPSTLPDTTTVWLPNWLPTWPTTLPSTSILPRVPTWLPSSIMSRWGISTTKTTTIEQTVVIGTKDPKIVKWEPVTMNPLFHDILPPSVSFESKFVYCLYS